jgi:hypothetical protein
MAKRPDKSWRHKAFRLERFLAMWQNAPPLANTNPIRHDKGLPAVRPADSFAGRRPKSLVD